MTWFTKKRVAISIVAVFVLLISAAFLTFVVQTSAPQEQSEVVKFEVESGDTVNTVSKRLADENLIRSPFFTQILVRLNGLSDLRVGIYDLDKSWDAKKIFEALNTQVTSEDLIARLPEGGWAKDYAKILGEAFGIDSAAFLSAWNDEVYIRELMSEYSVLTDEIFNNKTEVRVLLEGYLYPDTYYFSPDSSVDTITRRVLDNTQRKYETYKDQLNKTDFTLHELITFSSVVLYESHDYESMRTIAGVFMNRLEINMRLQSSVTVCYSLYEFEDWRECEAWDNLQIDSPYNTYVYTGLPVGPILNPTAEAIIATINYSDHDYFFFFSDVESGGDGTIYYSKSYAEHEAKREEIRQQNQN